MENQEIKRKKSFSVETKTYSYDKSDFDFSGTRTPLNEFFKLLKEGYQNAYNARLFNYEFKSFDTGKVIPGNRKLFLSLIPERKTKRRKPYHFEDLNTSFNHDAFNFTKSQPSETICILKNKDETQTSTNHIIINASPMANLHSLIIPRISMALNQILDEYAINLALQVMLLFNLPHLIAGFNSLCAAASVNHQHFHIWLMYNQDLFIHTAKVKKISKEIYSLVDPILNAFAFQLTNEDLSTLTKHIYKVVEHLQSHNIPYNLIMCRAGSFEKPPTPPSQTPESPQTPLFVSVFVFPRIKHSSNKEEEHENLSFGVACAELAGFVPVYESKAFTELTQERIEEAIQKYMMDDKSFQELIHAIIK